jgi:hypothetical protein
LGIATACSPYVQRGAALYREGRYVEAAEVFELTEHRLASSPPSVRAEYALFRGLTFLRLDDLRDARPWLNYASAMERTRPGTLPPARLALLARGWAELERRWGNERAAPDPSRVAAADAGGLSRPGGGTNGRRSVVP